MISVFTRCLWVVLLLTGCTHAPQEAQVSQEARTCKVRCQVAYERCQEQCHDACKPCVQQGNEQATAAYKRYHHERCVQGKTIVRQLQSYCNPLECRKTSCDCPADYRMCVEGCSGEIHKRLQVLPTC